MADHGTVYVMPRRAISSIVSTGPITMHPSTPILAGILSGSFRRTGLNSNPVGNFALAGTVDNSYHPPTVGQLWPRGDLDAT